MPTYKIRDPQTGLTHQMDWPGLNPPTSADIDEFLLGKKPKKPTIGERIGAPIAGITPRMRQSMVEFGQPGLETKFPRLRGFASGVGESITDAATGLSSPLAIGLAATGPLSRIPGVPGTVSRGLQKAASSGLAGHGAYRMGKGALEGNYPDIASGITEAAGGLLMYPRAPKLNLPPSPPQGRLQIAPEITELKPTAQPDWIRNALREIEEREKASGREREIKLTGLTEPVSQAAHLSVNLPKPKESSLAIEALNLPRGIMASYDLSAPLRQGIGMAHRGEFWRALPGMFKALASEAEYQAIQSNIASRPLFRTSLGPRGKILPSFAEKSGLKLSNLNSLSGREEMIMSTWAEKVPGVRGTNRAYSAFLNQLKADTFEFFINKSKDLGRDAMSNPGLARSIANFVNVATGMGSLGQLEQHAVLLNSTLFAPRLIASRLQMMGNIFNPHFYTKTDPLVRKEALKSLFTISSTGILAGQLARFAGADVESSMISPDFGKIQIGKTRIDPFAGFQQYIVLASQLLTNEVESSVTNRKYELGEDFGRPTRLSTIGKFAESKSNPVISFVTQFLRGKDFNGQPFNVPEEVASRFIPIFLQDVKEVLTENPDLVPFIHKRNPYRNFYPLNAPLLVPPFFGAGIQQYGSRRPF